ncbi:DNA-binding domain-containing protein [Rhizobium mesoamericanum]|uniref:Putative DNA-binding domain-containing protein n=1 Tax=Rhizobium mesoamericanum STM3625 TaxID=1211777 RepID=K0Q302_9HYPH|nr:DNA-binding domain-containing protein [Rhizobium mesoamericanum]CCM79100.1 conserved hypothetical protein [Rhizobium mesoamericanum STM3625]
MSSAEVLAIRPNTSDFVHQFAGGLLSPDRPAPTLITGPRGKHAKTGYAIYRNNVTVSLIEALASIFPAVQRITGPDFFRAMARFHVRETPPNSPLLFEYGRGFPDFIDRYEYAQAMPWLSDVARIERAWLDAYHAADAHALNPAALALASPQEMGALVLQPHPAMRVISSSYPAVTIFAMNRSTGSVGRVEPRPEDGLISRLGDEVSIRVLQPGGADFINALVGGEPLAVAAAAGLAAHARFDLTLAICEIIAAGAFSHIAMENSNVEHA